MGIRWAFGGLEKRGAMGNPSPPYGYGDADATDARSRAHGKNRPARDAEEEKLWRGYKELLNRVNEGGFAVALSGGGHRATLAAIGTMLALVDRGLNRKVLQIASISGGSIANAYLAQRCEFDAVTPEEFERHAKDLARKVVEKGVLTWPWLIGTLAACVMVAFGITHITHALLPTEMGTFKVIPSALVGLLAGAGVLIIGGTIVEWLLDRRFFRVSGKKERSGQNRACISSIAGRRVDHVFGMTDLVLGLPFLVSNKAGGVAGRWLDLPSTFDKPPLFQTFGVGHWSIAEVVRASAGFPGIAPRRVKLPRDPKNPRVAASPRLAFLADGGIWNNLGTQILREGMFSGHLFVEDGRVHRPLHEAPYMPVLVMNGSAPHGPANAFLYYVPGFALLASLKQIMLVLNSNTVLPRVAQMRRSFERRKTQERRPNHHDELDLIVDLSPPKQTRSTYARSWLEGAIRRSDQTVKDWEAGALLHVRAALEKKKKGDETAARERLASILRCPEPPGSFPAVGLAYHGDWDAAFDTPGPWNKIVEKEAKTDPDAPTTLGRIKPKVARAVIARAYLNTFVASLYLGPLGKEDIERLRKLSERLDEIVPSSVKAKRWRFLGTMVHGWHTWAHGIAKSYDCARGPGRAHRGSRQAGDAGGIDPRPKSPDPG